MRKELWLVGGSRGGFWFCNLNLNRYVRQTHFFAEFWYVERWESYHFLGELVSSRLGVWYIFHSRHPITSNFLAQRSLFVGVARILPNG